MSRIVIITGASSGLGLSLAKRFTELGDEVLGISRTKIHWPETKKQLRGKKNFSLIQLDVTSEQAVKQLLNRIYKAKKRVDILINNAGYAARSVSTEKLTLSEFNKNIEHNLISTFLMCKYTIPIFQRQGKGLMINISSMAGKRAVPRLVAYSVSKFGVVALTQAIAKENEGSGWKCFTVCPGGMNTEMRAKLFGRADARRQQSSNFVADIIMKVVDGKIRVSSGGDIVIRHGKVTAINALPPA